MNAHAVNLSGSSVATVVQSIRPSVRNRLGLSDNVLAIWSTVIEAARLMTDDSDPRDLNVRLATLENSLPALNDQTWAENSRRAEESIKHYAAAWQRYLTRHTAKHYLHRMIGENVYRKLTVAMYEDLGTLTVAGRRALRFILPWAVALDNASTLVVNSQRSALAAPLTVETSLFEMATTLDSLMEKILGMESLRETLINRPEERIPLKDQNFTEMIQALSEIVTRRTRASLQELSRALTRKIDGARVALENSPDAVSQAANSLIELIDRLLRQSFTEAEVLLWAKENYSDWKDLSFISREDRVRPTKLSQALCFAYAGQKVDQRSFFAELTALSLREARARLQKLKHSDSEDPQIIESERQSVLLAMAAIEAYLHISLSITWGNLPDEKLKELRSRLVS